MARGGIYDQLAGGFARYSVDERWVVPHFEKMLYDNALLLRVYTQLWRLTGDRLALRVATETADFLFRDLFDGAFVSSLDADTGGVEGATYVWTPEQLRQVLGDEDGAFAADLLAVTDRGSFEHGTSVLRLARDIDDADDTVRQRWAGLRRRLLEARAVRPQPARDDKVVAAWNGLAITGLAEFALAVLGDAHRADDSATATRRDVMSTKPRYGPPSTRGPRENCWRRCIWSTGGCAGPRAVGSVGAPGRRTRRLRLRRRGVLRPAPADRRGPLARARRWPAGFGPGPLHRWRSRFSRHRRRRRTTGRPAGRPDRQRHAVRPLVAGRGPGQLHRAHRQSRPTGRRPSGRWKQ